MSDLKNTLLHEMIHAYIFLRKIRDTGDHGPAFQRIMHQINASTVYDPYRPQHPPPGGYRITVCHEMHGEVDLYRQHHWRCVTCSQVRAVAGWVADARERQRLEMAVSVLRSHAAAVASSLA